MAPADVTPPDRLSDPPASPGPPATPRWVKVSGLVVVLLVLAVVLFVALRGGEHGPGMHGAQGVPAPGPARVQPQLV